jgi:exodeoxyribonuclease VII small subunit
MEKEMNEKSKEVPFEKLLENLEVLVNQLEKGELSLENSLTAYEKGIGFVKEAEQRLEKMEGRIEQLMLDGKKKPLEEKAEARNAPIDDVAF